jgi:hypothetical protein
MTKIGEDVSERLDVIPALFRVLVTRRPKYACRRAENWAMLASLVATCKMSGVNPVDYIAATLRAILDGHPKSGIETMMPWRFNQPSSLAA